MRLLGGQSLSNNELFSLNIELVEYGDRNKKISTA